MLRLTFVVLRTPLMPERLLKHGLCQVVMRCAVGIILCRGSVLRIVRVSEKNQIELHRILH